MSEYYFETDHIGQPIVPVVILANKDGRKIGTLNIDQSSLVISVELEDSQILLSEMSCDVHKYINTYLNPLWDEVRNFKTVCIPINVPYIKSKSLWYEIEVTIDEEDETIKHLTGTLAQYAELSQCSNYEVEIRTEADMARDDYIDTVFYNPDEPDASIVHRVLHDKANHYLIKHVDSSLWNVKRTFSFDGDTIIDCLKTLAEEVGCIIIFGESTTNDEEFVLERTISFYDAKDYCPECGKRGDFTNGCTNPECSHTQKIVPRYGVDTPVFINHENLGEGVSLSTDVDSIKNCFRMTAGDDDMTAAVILCNPSGSRYIWKFTADMKTDMSTVLRNKINQYETDYNGYRYYTPMSYVTKVADYNTLYNKYKSYMKDELGTLPTTIKGYTNLTKAYYYVTYLKDFLGYTMFPDSPDVVDTTAQKELAKFKTRTVGVRSLSGLSKSTTADEITELAKLYIDDAQYYIEVTTTSYANKTWNGTIVVTSYTDDDDTASLTTTMTFTQATDEYIKAQVDKYIKRKEAMVSGVVDLCKLSLTDFKAEIKKYNADALVNVRAAIDAVLSMLDDAGITQASDPDVYNEIYKPYSDKLNAVTSEISVRDSEVSKLDTLLKQIESQQKMVNDSLDLEKYLGSLLWTELLTFRRETEQTDDTIISTGLTNAEIIENAMEFYNRADEDIDKLTEAVYTIDCSLKDLLLLSPDTYSRIKPVFDVGNWIRIEVDDRVYKLRLLSYEIDFSDLTTINVSFSSAKISNDITSTFHQVKKTANNINKGIADISKKVSQTSDTANLINDVADVQFVYTPARHAVVSLKASAIQMNETETLEDYVKRVATDVSGALAITMTNEFQAVTTNEEGQGGDYSECSTSVSVLYSGVDITNNNDIEWNVIIPQTATGTWNENTHTISVTNVEGDSASIEVHVSYKGLSVQKNFVVKKIKVDTSGSSAYSYKLNASDTIVSKTQDGQYIVNSVTFSATYKVGNEPTLPYSGRFKIESIAEGESWQTEYISVVNESSVVFTIPEDIISIRCTLYQADNTTTILDIVTVPIVTNGIDGKDGIDAVGLKETVFYYLASDQETGITKSSDGWTRFKPELTETNKYLWTYSVSRYAISDSDPELIEIKNNTVTFENHGEVSPVDNCIVDINPVQEGSGDPSAENIRTISGWKAATITHNSISTTITFPTEVGTVYSGILNVTQGTLIVDSALIDSYNGETLPSTWISDRDVYAEGTVPTTGAQVLYQLDTPIVYDITSQEIAMVAGQNTISANTGQTAIAYYDNQTSTEPHIDYTMTSVVEMSADALSTATSINDRVNAIMGTCSTSAGTSTKLVTCNNFKAYAGVRIQVYFTNANTASLDILKMNVNNTGDIPIYVNDSQVNQYNQLLWAANVSITFVLVKTSADTLYWKVEGAPFPLYGICSSTADFISKIVSSSGAVICKGTSISIKMTNTNTAAEPKLDVQSTGAKLIYANNEPLTSNSRFNWRANTTQKFVFDGQYWRMDDDSVKALATAYITKIDEDGIMVHPEDDNTSGWAISDAIQLFKNGFSYIKLWIENNIPKIRLGKEDQGHLILDNDSVDVMNDDKVLASFGATSVIGDEDDWHQTIAANQITFAKGNNTITYISPDKLYTINAEVADAFYISNYSIRNASDGKLVIGLRR